MCYNKGTQARDLDRTHDTMTHKLDPKVKQLWLEALRSGKYEQTRECLRDQHGYCCLGVLQDLYIQHTSYADWIEIVDGEPHDIGYDEFPEVGCNQWAFPSLLQTNFTWTLRNTVSNLYTFSKDPNSERLGRGSLPAMNDNGSSFSEIADIIEEHF